MSKTDPAFLLYAADWLSSTRVRAMSREQRGAYIDLLCFAWLDGSIPGDAGALQTLLGASRAEFRRIWPAMEGCWEQRDDGRLVNPRQERERQERKARAEDIRRRSALGNRARWGSPSDPSGSPTGTDQGIPDVCPSTSNVPPNPPQGGGPLPPAGTSSSRSGRPKRRRVVAVAHVPNMPLGATCCACEECERFRVNGLRRVP